MKRMVYTQIILFTLATLTLGNNMSAQQDSAWTLEKCINYALEQTGVFFGWYPARKAASLDPIYALRYE